MPCEPIVTNGKITGWACRRSREKSKPPVCYQCGKPATNLCDHRKIAVLQRENSLRMKFVEFVASIDTCDRPMCDSCSNSAGENEDYCGEHNNEHNIASSRLAEKLHRHRLRQMRLKR